MEKVSSNPKLTAESVWIFQRKSFSTAEWVGGSAFIPDPVSALATFNVNRLLLGQRCCWLVGLRTATKNAHKIVIRMAARSIQFRFPKQN